jgi:metal-responsive CopG/Arc/MetJ family transcriptional regulator
MVKRASEETKSVSATLDYDLAERLDAYCARNRLSRSQGIAHAIEYFLEDRMTETRDDLRKRAISSLGRS